MRCSKCGTPNPDAARFCSVCGHKLQSDRQPAAETPEADPASPASSRPPLTFQGWTSPGRGSGRYLEACLYAVILMAGVIWCLYHHITWPLYPLLAALALVAWWRRL